MSWVVGLGLLLTTTVTSSIGVLYFKKAMNNIKVLNYGNILRSAQVYQGVASLVVSGITTIILLDTFEYSVVFPLMALSYVWTLLISVFAFREKVTATKVFAIILILIGVLVVSR